MIITIEQSFTLKHLTTLWANNLVMAHENFKHQFQLNSALKHMSWTSNATKLSCLDERLQKAGVHGGDALPPAALASPCRSLPTASPQPPGAPWALLGWRRPARQAVGPLQLQGLVLEKYPTDTPAHLKFPEEILSPLSGHAIRIPDQNGLSIEESVVSEVYWSVSLHISFLKLFSLVWPKWSLISCPPPLSAGDPLRTETDLR